jgi:O-antigen/teichoic acid export membrane protein
MQHRVLRGGAWLLGADLAGHAIGLIKMLVMARLLAPKDFGLMGLAVLVLAWFDVFSQTGFSTALIRKPGDVGSYLATFWTVQTIRGILLASMIFVCAPLAGWVFHSPDVVPIVRAISVVAILRGAANPAIIYLRRELQMGREVLWRLGGSLTGLLVGLPVAFAYRTVWALVIAALAANVAELTLSYWIVSHRPRFEVNWAKARELMRYGKWVFWSNISTYLSQCTDGWVVGHYFASASVGYYQMAQQLGMTPLANIGGHITAVALPAFSNLRQPQALRSAFLRSIGFVSTALFPAGALVTIFSAPLVRLVLGERWMPVCPLLRLLTWVGILAALSGVSVAFLQAIDRPDLSARAAFLKLVGFALLAYPLMRYFGVAGVALAALISCPISVCYLYAQAVGFLGWNWDLLLVFWPALVACIPAFAAAVILPFSPPVWVTASVGGLAALSCVVLVGRRLWTSPALS